MSENLRTAIQILAAAVLLVFGYIMGYHDGGYPRRQAMKKRGVRR